LSIGKREAETIPDICRRTRPAKRTRVTGRFYGSDLTLAPGPLTSVAAT